MPRYGFSGQAPDMRKLILHILKTLGIPAGWQELQSLALIDDNADYFLFSDALTGLLEGGAVFRDGEAVALTPKGAEIADITGGELPAALRRAVAEETAAARDRRMRARCVTAEAEEKDGWFHGVLSDGRETLLDIRLQTGSAEKAAAVKKGFERNAETILQRIWEVMT